MKKVPETIQPPSYVFDKPAKQRIIEASDKLFRRFGIRVGSWAIACEAHSNMETVVKYFGHGEGLVVRFLKSLIEEADESWHATEGKANGDPEAQLRWWLAVEQDRTGHSMRPEVLLSRTAAELQCDRNDTLLGEIAQYWHAERRRVVGLCRAAGLREPVELGDKLVLLVHGARNERDAYGRFAPSRLLQQAGNDLLIAHGASSKHAIEPTIA